MGSSSAPDITVVPTTDDIPTVSDGCVVWHCRQLRTTDHPALAYAAREYDTLLPVFVFDPSFYGRDGLACDARIRFMHESLHDVTQQYTTRTGTPVTFAHGSPTTVLPRFYEDGWDIVTTADPTGRYGLRRDNAVAEACDVTFIDADGLVRGTEDTRDGWTAHAEDWLTDDQATWDETTVTVTQVDTPVSPSTIETTYDITPQKDITRTGGTKQAVQHLERFIENISDYPGSISAPTDARSGTSQLSPYLRFGCLSVRQVYQAIDSDVTDTRAKELFVSRLFWNRHYNQKLADWPGWMDTAVNPVLEDFHADTHDPELVTAWKHGNTGYPMVDASMRCLTHTGWLNFRMRAMCASFLCDLLQQPWKIGADWFYYHLLDADPAINYTQFQIQAGVDGTNMMRVYNPRKQVTDNDPDGEFITKWVPELVDLPGEHLARPEKTPIHVQNESGVSIDEDYPRPIVEYETARANILDKFRAVRPQAKQALDHPEVARRVSITHQNTVENAKPATKPSDTSHDTTTQSSLGQFN